MSAHSVDGIMTVDDHNMVALGRWLSLMITTWSSRLQGKSDLQQASDVPALPGQKEAFEDLDQLADAAAWVGPSSGWLLEQGHDCNFIGAESMRWWQALCI